MKLGSAGFAFRMTYVYLGMTDVPLFDPRRSLAYRGRGTGSGLVVAARELDRRGYVLETPGYRRQRHARIARMGDELGKQYGFLSERSSSDYLPATKIWRELYMAQRATESRLNPHFTAASALTALLGVIGCGGVDHPEVGRV